MHLYASAQSVSKEYSRTKHVVLLLVASCVTIYMCDSPRQAVVATTNYHQQHATHTHTMNSGKIGSLFFVLNDRPL